VQLRSIRHGEPHPVRFLLVHGLASNARLWDAVGAALAERGQGSIAVDLRGHGESPKPDDGYDFATVTGDLLPFLDGRPVVVGQSYGGNVVVELAARQPEAVGGVVCIDGGAIDLRSRFGSVDEALAALRPPYEQFEGTALVQQEARLRRGHPDWPDISIRGALAGFEIDGDGGIRSRLRWSRHQQIVRAMWETPPSARWPVIRAPVLFLVASGRMRTAVDAAVAQLATSEAVWFEGADHDLHAQKPDVVADHLVRWAARADGAEPDGQSQPARRNR
jgi:pimeloyl-ACP methyl ester carboxylesterase